MRQRIKMSHTSFFNKQNNNSIVSYVFQFYSDKGLLYQSPLFTNLETLQLEAFKKINQLDDCNIQMEIVKFD